MDFSTVPSAAALSAKRMVCGMVELRAQETVGMTVELKVSLMAVKTGALTADARDL